MNKYTVVLKNEDGKTGVSIKRGRYSADLEIDPKTYERYCLQKTLINEFTLKFSKVNDGSQYFHDFCQLLKALDVKYKQINAMIRDSIGNGKTKYEHIRIDKKGLSPIVTEFLIKFDNINKTANQSFYEFRISVGIQKY